MKSRTWWIIGTVILVGAVLVGAVAYYKKKKKCSCADEPDGDEKAPDLQDQIIDRDLPNVDDKVINTPTGDKIVPVIESKDDIIRRTKTGL